MLDLKNALCYSMSYLSDERFLFARFFPRRDLLLHMQGGNARPPAGK